MTVSDVVRMAIIKNGMSQADLAAAWGCSYQAINKKFIRDTWTGNDLVKLAGILGSKLALIYPDGQQLLFLPDEPKPEE
jgi:ribosome-binding protein aMBF1 (putative translation factor)